MTTTEFSKDIDHIRRDIASLREDVASLTTSLKHLAAARGREAIGRIEDLGDRTKVKAEDLKHGAEREIGEHPFTSVLTSFGLGFVLGMALDPKR
jgi:ElaB/YqjD/DUF883 family membrane-anchored ribosome-binding protein